MPVLFDMIHDHGRVMYDDDDGGGKDRRQSPHERHTFTVLRTKLNIIEIEPQRMFGCVMVCVRVLGDCTSAKSHNSWQLSSEKFSVNFA